MAEPDANEEKPDGAIVPAEATDAAGARDDDGRDDRDDDEDGDYDDDEIDDGPFTSGDFHTVTQKLVINAVYETLADTKLDWQVVRPFLGMARDMALGDFEEARFRLHTVRAEGENWVEAEEAYLGLSVADRDDGQEWLSETRWLSDIATADDDPEQVRLIIAALQRTIGKLETWLGEKEAGDAAEATPPA